MIIINILCTLIVFVLLIRSYICARPYFKGCKREATVNDYVGDLSGGYKFYTVKLNDNIDFLACRESLETNEIVPVRVDKTTNKIVSPFYVSTFKTTCISLLICISGVIINILS